MGIYWILVAAVGLLLIVSSGTEIHQEGAWYRRPFQKGAVYLFQKCFKSKSNAEEARETAKLETMLMCLVLGLLILPFLEGAVNQGIRILETYQLVRPEKGQGDSSYSLQAELTDTKETEWVQLEVKERQYTVQEKKELLKKAEEELDRVVLGENASPDEVREKIVLPAELQNGEVSVQWIGDLSEWLDADGNVTAKLDENGEVVTLTALLSCDEQELVYETALHFYPELRTEEEQLRHDLQQALTAAQEAHPEEAHVQLPKEVAGRKIVWMEKGQSVMRIGLLLVLLAAAGGYFAREEEFKKKELQRKQEQLLDYPDIVFKMGMLLNAGLTIQNAFVRITEEYLEMRESGRKRWAYEEMAAACNEMKSGISEARAYERFGRRCDQTCYIRLGTILSGSLQKSSEGMTSLLLEEAGEAMEERRQLARKMGEEAGTKLLFPMILMLLVVLVILIVPALMTF